MKLTEAREIAHEVNGKSYTWMKAWGISWIREAIYTIEQRKSSTKADREMAFGIRRKLSRKW